MLSMLFLTATPKFFYGFTLALTFGWMIVLLFLERKVEVRSKAELSSFETCRSEMSRLSCLSVILALLSSSRSREGSGLVVMLMKEVLMSFGLYEIVGCGMFNTEF